MTPDIRRTRNAGHTEYGNTLSMLYRGINVRHKKTRTADKTVRKASPEYAIPEPVRKGEKNRTG